MRRKSSSKARGSAIIEMALLAPWIFFLFVGALDWGFYAYSLITLETATRTAALYEASQTSTSSVTSSGACTIVLNEMSTLINMSGVTCPATAAPLVVSATTDTSTDGGNEAVVSATYTTPQMVPVPGVLSGKFTITRTVKMKM